MFVSFDTFSDCWHGHTKANAIKKNKFHEYLPYEATLNLAKRSFKVIRFGGKRYYDFIQVVNSNFFPVSEI